jgi:ribonuclease HI
MVVVAATDGGAIGNPGPAGWAWVTEDGREGWARARRSTNNRMELRAVLELLGAIDRNEELVIQTDSQYVHRIFTEWLDAWKQKGMRTSARRPVENQDLIMAIDDALRDRTVTFEWVRGHAGHPLNERADQLANAAARSAFDELNG